MGLLLFAVAAILLIFVGLQRWLSRLPGPSETPSAAPDHATFGASDVTSHTVHQAAWTHEATHSPPGYD